MNVLKRCVAVKSQSQTSFYNYSVTEKLSQNVLTGRSIGQHQMRLSLFFSFWLQLLM